MSTVVQERSTRFSFIASIFFGLILVFLKWIVLFRASTQIKIGVISPVEPLDLVEENQDLQDEMLTLTYKPGSLIFPLSDLARASNRNSSNELSVLRYPFFDQDQSNYKVSDFENYEDQRNYERGLKWALEEYAAKRIGKQDGYIYRYQMPFGFFLFLLNEKVVPGNRAFGNGHRVRDFSIPYFVATDENRLLIGNSNKDMSKILSEEENQLLKSIRLKIHYISTNIYKNKYQPVIGKEYERILLDLMAHKTIEDELLSNYPLDAPIPQWVIDTKTRRKIIASQASALKISNSTSALFSIISVSEIPEEYQLTRAEKAYISSKIEIKDTSITSQEFLYNLHKEYEKIMAEFNKDKDVIKMVAHIHMMVVKPHIFRDGNGRLARMVMNILGRQYGLPTIIFHNKKEYQQRVNDASHRNDRNIFVNYVRNILLSKNLEMTAKLRNLMKDNKSNCRKAHVYNSCLTFLRDGYDRKRAAAEHKKEYRKSKQRRLRAIRSR